MTLYIANYQRSEKRRLIEAVEFLCDSKGRPVSSNDLKEYFHCHPSLRPILTQRFGQLLIKAARPSRFGLPRLFPCGMWQHHKYYAPNADPAWNERFQRFVINERVRNEVSIQYFETVRYLLGGEYDREVRNALAAWILEFSPLVCSSINNSYAGALVRQMDMARRVAAADYFQATDLGLISRQCAMALLYDAVRLRCPHRLEFKINYNHYLAELSWPQSSLFPTEKVLVYREAQVRATISNLWPLDQENPEEAGALRWMLRY